MDDATPAYAPAGLFLRWLVVGSPAPYRTVIAAVLVLTVLVVRTRAVVQDLRRPPGNLGR